MQELIAKLEAATEGSRELDAEIAAAVYPFFAAGAKVAGHPDPGLRQCKPWGRVRASDCTTSIDAALTLVPPDCDWLINGRGNYAQVWEAKETGRDGSWGARARTAPLSLCIAALRARQKEKHDG